MEVPKILKWMQRMYLDYTHLAVKLHQSWSLDPGHRMNGNGGSHDHWLKIILDSRNLSDEKIDGLWCASSSPKSTLQSLSHLVYLIVQSYINILYMEDSIISGRFFLEWSFPYQFRTWNHISSRVIILHDFFNSYFLHHFSLLDNLDHHHI